MASYEYHIAILYHDALCNYWTVILLKLSFISYKSRAQDIYFVYMFYIWIGIVMSIWNAMSIQS